MQKDASAGDIIGPTTFLSRVSTQGRNYSTLVVWLLYTVFKGRTKTLTISIILNLVHLATQAAAIFIIYWYAKQMEDNGIVSVPYLNLDVNLKGQLQWLWVVVIVSTACFVISASLFFLSRKLALNIAEEHYGQSLENLVLTSRHLPDPRARRASRLLLDFGIGGLSTGCRRGALIATAFVNAIAAIVGAVGATVFLIRIDPSLTLLILVSAILAALLLYPLTLRAVHSAKAREKAQAAFSAERRRFYEIRTSEQSAESMTTATELARAYLLRQRVLSELVFAIEIGVTIILGVVVYYMASQAFAGREQWAIFIAYIGALRIALAGISAAIQAFASVSRFYPGIVRYYLFTKDVEKMNAAPLAKVEHGDTIILGTLPSGMDVIARAGQRIAVATGDPVHKVLLALIDARLPEPAPPVGAAVVDSAGIACGEGGIALVYCDRLDGEAGMENLADVLRDKVALVVYGRPDKIGACGEAELLTIADAELRRFVPLGTSDAEAALKEIAELMAKKRGVLFEDDDEDEEV